jgi:hypothetical protein
MGRTRLMATQQNVRPITGSAFQLPGARSRYPLLLLLVCLYAFLDCLCDKLFLLGNKVFSVL